MLKLILALKYLKIKGNLINFIALNFDGTDIEKLLKGDVLELQFKYGVFDDSSLGVFYNQNLISQANSYANEQIRLAEENNTEIITFYDKRYPQSLRNMRDASPLLLYAKGNIELLNSPQGIACVGTRNPSVKTNGIVKECIKEISKKDGVIISGLAEGVDSIAHKSALDYGVKTIAVMATEITSIYPQINIHLANEILKNDGLLVTEYEFNSKINKSKFVKRNRIIAGLSEGVIVFEASEKSGTMHTVNFAVKDNKKIYCPNLNIIYSEGTELLIRKKIANPFKDFKDIAEDLFPRNIKKITVSLTEKDYAKLKEICGETDIEGVIKKWIKERIESEAANQ